MHRSVILVAALVTACDDAAIVVVVPFEPSDRAALVTIEEGSALDVFAVDARTRDMTPVLRSITGFKGDERLVVSAFFYAERLDELGLEPGPVALPSASEPSRPVPAYARARTSVVGKDSASPWRPITALDGALARLRLPNVARCQDFVIERRPLDAPWVDPVFLRGSAGETMLVVTSSAGTSAFRATLDGLVPLDLTLTGPLTAATAGLDGRIWLARREGLSVGTFAGGFQPVAGAPRNIRALVAPGDPADTADVYALTVTPPGARFDFDLERLEGGRWTREGGVAGGRPYPGPLRRQDPWRTRLTWLGPRHVLAITDGARIFRARDGRFTAEDLSPTLLGDTVTAVGVVPGLGPILGLLSGQLAREAPTTWDPFAGALVLENSIFAITSYQGGFAIGAVRGTVAQYFDGAPCEDAVVYLGADVEVRALAAVEGGLLAVEVRAGPEIAGPPDGAASYVTLREAH